HIHLPKQEGVGGSSVRAVLAQGDLLLADRGIRARVRIDLMTHEVLGGPATRTSSLQGSSLRENECYPRICAQMDWRRAGVGQESARSQPLLRRVEHFHRDNRFVF